MSAVSITLQGVHAHGIFNMSHKVPMLKVSEIQGVHTHGILCLEDIYSIRIPLLIRLVVY